MTARASFESRLRELLAEGTPGPWHDGWQGHGTDETYMVWSSKSADLVCATSCLKRGYEDAELIVAAVNALPKLLDVVTEYADHRPGCPKWGIEGDSLGLDGDVFAVSAGDECRCGFDTLLASLEDPSLQA